MENYKTVDTIPLIINNIEKSLAAEAYLAALNLALSIPEICGNILYDDGKREKDKSHKQYVKWFDEYMVDSFGIKYSDKYYSERNVSMNGDICYELRNQLVHNGTNLLREQRIKDSIPEFVLSFTHEPYVRGNYAGEDYDFRPDKLIDGQVPHHKYLYISVTEICLDIIRSVKICMEFNKNKFNGNNLSIRVNDGGGKVPHYLFQ